MGKNICSMETRDNDATEDSECANSEVIKRADKVSNEEVFDQSK